MGHVARHDHGAGQQQPRRDRVTRQVRQDFPHRPIQVDVYGAFVLPMSQRFGNVLERLELELLQEDAFTCDLALGLPVRAAGDADADGQ